MTGEIIPFSPGSGPKDARLRVASIRKPGGSKVATDLGRVIPFVPGTPDTGSQIQTGDDILSSDAPKILRFTPVKDWANEETYFDRKLRLKITSSVLTAILSADLASLERSPDKFIREIVNSIDKPNPQTRPSQVGSNKTSIIRCIERTIMELGKMQKEDLKKLPPNKKYILVTLNRIFNIRIRDAKSMGQEIDHGEVMIKLMDEIEEHFSPNPTSSPKL